MPKVIIAPLDWGLGHATRCVPLIEALQKLNVEVILCASGRGYLYYKEKFPLLQVVRLKDYRVKYFDLAIFNFFYNIPNLMLRYVQDRLAVSKLQKTFSPDFIISDNRFGFWRKGVKSIYITHQINIKTGYSFLDKMASWIHCLIIKKYQTIWIPDDTVRLSGELTDAKNIDKEIVKIGLLPSLPYRFSEVQIKVCFIISGPEPERSIFMKDCIRAARTIGAPSIIIGGTPDGFQEVKTLGEITIVPFVEGIELAKIVASAQYIVCKSGYSTLMDLVQFNKRLILVPTHGQGEQAYLAKYFEKKNWAIKGELKDLAILATDLRFNGVNLPEYKFDERKLLEILRKSLNLSN